MERAPPYQAGDNASIRSHPPSYHSNSSTLSLPPYSQVGSSLPIYSTLPPLVPSRNQPQNGMFPGAQVQSLFQPPPMQPMPQAGLPNIPQMFPQNFHPPPFHPHPMQLMPQASLPNIPQMFPQNFPPPPFHPPPMHLIPQASLPHFQPIPQNFPPPPMQGTPFPEPPITDIRQIRAGPHPIFTPIHPSAPFSPIGPSFMPPMPPLPTQSWPMQPGSSQWGNW
jgi:hypothetical protein